MRNILPTIELKFNKGFIPKGLTAIRSGSATYIDKYGKIQDAPANTARITYDTDGVCKGLVSERASTNVNTYADYPYTGTRGWTVSGSPAISVIDSIYGINAGLKLVWSPGMSIYKSVTGLTANTPYTWSCYVRGDGNFKMIEGLNNVGFTKIATDVWTRVFITVNSTAGGAFQMWIANQSSTSTFLEICGVQLEALPYATSLIKTAGSAVTRNEDLVYFTMPSSLYTGLKGTWIIEYERQAIATFTQSWSLIHISKSATPTSVPVFFEAFVQSAAADQRIYTRFCGDTTITTNAVMTNQSALSKKYACSFSSTQNDYTPQQKVFDDSVNVFNATKTDVTKTSGGTQYSPDPRLYIGCSQTASGSQLSGYFKKIVFYPAALTDAEVVLL